MVKAAKVMKVMKAMKGKGSGKQAGKPSKPVLDWQAFIQSEDTEAEAREAEGSDEEEEETNKQEEVTKRRASRTKLVVGEANDGQELPVDDASNYNARQIYVAKKYAATDPEFEAALSAAKKEGRMEHRKFINSKIPKDCMMSNTMTPATVTCKVDQQVGMTRNEGSSRKSVGKSLTAWEVAWGL